MCTYTSIPQIFFPFHSLTTPAHKHRKQRGRDVIINDTDQSDNIIVVNYLKLTRCLLVCDIQFMNLPNICLFILLNEITQFRGRFEDDFFYDHLKTTFFLSSSGNWLNH